MAVDVGTLGYSLSWVVPEREHVRNVLFLPVPEREHVRNSLSWLFPNGFMLEMSFSDSATAVGMLETTNNPMAVLLRQREA